MVLIEIAAPASIETSIAFTPSVRPAPTLGSCPFSSSCRIGEDECSLVEHMRSHKLATHSVKEGPIDTDVVIDLSSRSRRAGLILQYGEHYFLWTLESRRRADGEVQVGIVARALSTVEAGERFAVTLTANGSNFEWCGTLTHTTNGCRSHEHHVSRNEALVLLWPTHQHVFPPQANSVHLSIRTCVKQLEAGW